MGACRSNDPRDIVPIDNEVADLAVDVRHGRSPPGDHFTFSPPYDGHQVVSYQYRLPNGPPRTVAADPNSQTATVQFTPTHAGAQTLTVQSINGDAPGGSCQASYTFVVASTPR